MIEAEPRAHIGLFVVMEDANESSSDQQEGRDEELDAVENNAIQPEANQNN